MSIPKYNELMLPILKLVGDKKTHNLRKTHDDLALQFNLSEAELRELLPSGKQTIFLNRMGWAKTYLSKAKFIESKGRGHFSITERGLKVLENPPQEINRKYLNQFDEFMNFQTRKAQTQDDEINVIESKENEQTPEEILEETFDLLKTQLASQLLEQVKQCSPFFFEQVVVDLLVSMGYGGSHKDAGTALQKSHDEGIDGIIKEDRLGLDVIYVQAKRWKNCVGRPDIQAFAGSLEGFRARKGIFITTSNFSKQAHEYVQKIEKKIILIDGEMLTKLMIDYNVGVSEEEKYILKKIDIDYFEEA